MNDLLIDCSDGSIYQNIIFDIDISYHIVSYCFTTYRFIQRYDAV